MEVCGDMFARHFEDKITQIYHSWDTTLTMSDVWCPHGICQPKFVGFLSVYGT